MVRVAPLPAAEPPAAETQSAARAPASTDFDYDDGEPEVAATSRAPQIPSSANVARQATISNAINLRQINLIGVYGTASDRRALIRLANGRFVKVQVGDRVDGGQVAAIGEREVRYVKGGQNHVLSLPRG
jgi:type IV pilus biogenesis protein PilP